MKIDVIIPCYNAESTVSRTIESVLSQTYQNFRILLVNDGSTDNTLSILNDFKSIDSRIEVLDKKNGGVSSARNFGINHIESNLTVFLDSDDYFEVSLFENAVSIIQNEDIDLFSFGFRQVDENARLLKTHSNSRYGNQIFHSKELTQKYFLREVNQHICSMIIKSEVIIQNKLRFDENTKYAEDIEFFLKCIANSHKLYYSSDVYFNYVQRKGSAMETPFIRNTFDVYHRINNNIDSNVRDYYHIFLNFVFLSFINHILKKGANKETVQLLLSEEEFYIARRIPIDKKYFKYIIVKTLYKCGLKWFIVKKYTK